MTPGKESARRSARLLTWLLPVLVAATVADFLFGRRAFLLSIRFSAFLQKFDQPFPPVLFSTLTHNFQMVYIILMTFLRKDKVGSWLNLVGLFNLVGISSVLKLLYLDSRPSFESDSLLSHAHYCVNDYGKPSGHALFSTGLFLFMYRDLSANEVRGRGRLLLVGFFVVYSLLMGFYRLYLGVHSVNQVVLGYLWGLAIFLFTVAAQDKYVEWFLGPLFLPERHSDRRKFLLFTLGTLAAIHAWFLASWALLFYGEHVDSDYFKAIVNCAHVKQKIFLGFSTKNSQEGLTSSFPYAFALGAALSSPSPRLWLDFTYDNNLANILKRLAATGAVAAFVLLGYRPLSDSPVWTMVRAVVVMDVVCFTLGIALPRLFDLFRIPYKKEEKLE